MVITAAASVMAVFQEDVSMAIFGMGCCAIQPGRQWTVGADLLHVGESIRPNRKKLDAVPSLRLDQ